MITQKEFDLYRSPQFIRAVEENLHRRDVEIALDKNIPFARELATRVKYLQKAKTKLPSFYKARCIIPARAYEQSTSEAVAFEKPYSGKICIDLTCGLGVDTFALSKGFEKVIAVERDPQLSQIARHNFGLLGADNIEVVNASAEEYLSANPALEADIIYCDPDRRTDEGKRVAAIQDCSPDILSLMPRLKDIAPKVVVKLSPLFDIHEAFRLFGDHTKVTVISEGGECKEVLVETGMDSGLVAARITGGGEVAIPYSGPTGRNADTSLSSPGYLALPDVSLVKSGIAKDYYSRHGWMMPSQNGFAFGDTPYPQFGSRIYRILRQEIYNPKKIKKLLHEKDIRRLNILMRDFPYPLGTVTKQLGITEGGERWAALTTLAGKQMFLLLEPESL